MRTLLLFDVDGTLISTAGKAFAVLLAAYTQVVGEPPVTNSYSPAGKTDPQIFRELMTGAGLSPQEQGLLLPQLLAAYRDRLRQELMAEHVRPLPGVRELLARLQARPDVALGLLTGNLREAAQHKLELAGLWSFFPVGSFGSDHHDRQQLLPLVVARAEQHFAQAFPYHRVIVIGDTPLDVRCGHAWGAKAVAVAGHTTPAAQLARAKPEAVVFSLEPELFVPVLAALGAG